MSTGRAIDRDGGREREGERKSNAAARTVTARRRRHPKRKLTFSLLFLLPVAFPIPTPIGAQPDPELTPAPTAVTNGLSKPFSGHLSPCPACVHLRAARFRLHAQIDDSLSLPPALSLSPSLCLSLKIPVYICAYSYNICTFLSCSLTFLFSAFHMQTSKSSNRNIMHKQVAVFALPARRSHTL